MRLLAPTALLAAAACLAQPPAPGAAALTVPAGTRIALRLTGPLATRTARAGDAVHAETAFPVTVSNSVAIPPGTYLEGVIDHVFPKGRHAGFTIHFARLVFSNGYTVDLSAATADTRAALVRPVDPMPADASPAPPPVAMGFQSSPTMPSVPHSGMGAAVGVGVGAAAAAGIVAVILATRGGYLDLRVGHRFEMVLADPLTLDSARVADAVANPAPR